MIEIATNLAPRVEAEIPQPAPQLERSAFDPDQSPLYATVEPVVKHPTDNEDWSDDDSWDDENPSKNKQNQDLERTRDIPIPSSYQ